MTGHAADLRAGLARPGVGSLPTAQGDLRWEAGTPRIEIASGPAVWIVGQVHAVALLTIDGDEGALRQLGLSIAERLTA
jgi:hypothetical protein